jgi:hypothetical protein
MENTTTQSHYISVVNKDGIPINIPVVDVRDGLAERQLAQSILKAVAKSKYIVYNEYHVSRKQVQRL